MSKAIPINEKPQRSELRFEREGDSLLITHTSLGSSASAPHHVLKAPFRSAMREIARKLRSFYDEVGYDGFVKHWHHRPPKDLIARAWNALAQTD
jgi:hypothetical protein